MKKRSAILIMGLAVLMVGTASSEAHEGEHPATVKHAVHELHEAKEVLAKLPPDSDGHIAKASQSVDQAIQELSSLPVPVEPKQV